MTNMKPLCVDLCCGSGGWAAGFIVEGYRVIGYDIYAQPGFPGEFRRRDVRSVSGHDFPRPAIIVASPPCEEFSRHQMPWTRRRNPPEPDLSIVEACWRIAAEAGAPLVLENVRMAQGWLGPAKAHYGSRYLWGDAPLPLPRCNTAASKGLALAGQERQKQSMSSSHRAERARIPIVLAQWVARCFAPVNMDRK